MARKIESYNASYPAAFYEIGTIYAFYAQGNAKGSPASEKQIQRLPQQGSRLPQSPL